MLTRFPSAPGLKTGCNVLRRPGNPFPFVFPSAPGPKTRYNISSPWGKRGGFYLTLLPDNLSRTRARLLRQALGSARRRERIDTIAGLLDDGETNVKAAGARRLIARFQAARANLHHHNGRVDEAIAVTETTLADYPDVLPKGRPTLRGSCAT